MTKAGDKTTDAPNTGPTTTMRGRDKTRPLHTRPVCWWCGGKILLEKPIKLNRQRPPQFCSETCKDGWKETEDRVKDKGNAGRLKRIKVNH